MNWFDFAPKKEESCSEAEIPKALSALGCRGSPKPAASTTVFTCKMPDWWNLFSWPLFTTSGISTASGKGRRARHCMWPRWCRNSQLSLQNLVYNTTASCQPLFLALITHESYFSTYCSVWRPTVFIKLFTDQLSPWPAVLSSLWFGSHGSDAHPWSCLVSLQWLQRKLETKPGSSYHSKVSLKSQSSHYKKRAFVCSASVSMTVRSAEKSLLMKVRNPCLHTKPRVPCRKQIPVKCPCDSNGLNKPRGQAQPAGDGSLQLPAGWGPPRMRGWGNGEEAPGKDLGVAHHCTMPPAPSEQGPSPNTSSLQAGREGACPGDTELWKPDWTVQGSYPAFLTRTSLLLLIYFSPKSRHSGSHHLLVQKHNL